MGNTFLATGHELFSNHPDTRNKAEKVGMLKQNATLITQCFISLSRDQKQIWEIYLNMRTPFPIGLWFAWSGKQVRYTGLYQSSNKKTGFTYGFWYGCYHSYGAPNQSCNVCRVCISECCSFPRESTDVYSGACRCNLGHIPTDSEETLNRCSYTTWTEQWWQHTHPQKRMVIISESCR